MKKQTGFTIVELLIVIVVIGILAAVSIVAYNGINERAKIQQEQANSELNTLLKAITTARINKDTHLFGVTGSNCTNCSTDPARYGVTIDRIATASGMNLDSIKDGNPWGNNYSIDENEGGGSTDTAKCANKDLLNLGTSGKTGIINTTIPFYGC